MYFEVLKYLFDLVKANIRKESQKLIMFDAFAYVNLPNNYNQPEGAI